MAESWVEVIAPTGETILADLDDYLALEGRSVSMSGNGYAQVWHDGTVRMWHAVIAGHPGGRGVVVDHINRNKLDNRRSNLRLVSPTKSNLNRKDVERVRHKFPKGVYRNRSGNFFSQISRFGKLHYLGTYSSIEAAKAAFDRKAEEMDSQEVK